MLAFGIILLVIGIIIFIIGIIAEYNDWDCCKILFGWFAAGFLCVGIILIDEYRNSNNEITPMDVYQGKTTLQYTIVDGVKVDSVVVWKSLKK